MMGTSSAEGDGLSFGFDMIHPPFLRKSAIVSMVMFDYDPSRKCETFEGFLGLESFLHVGGLLKVNKSKGGLVINKDGGIMVAILGDEPSDLSYKPWSCGL